MNFDNLNIDEFFFIISKKLIDVGHLQKNGFSILRQSSLNNGQHNKKWYSVSTSFSEQYMQYLWHLGILSNLPISIANLCEEILKRVSAWRYLVILIVSIYFSNSKLFLNNAYICNRGDLFISENQLFYTCHIYVVL